MKSQFVTSKRGGRLLAWSRWLHKGETFGRTGQIGAGLACVVMLILIVTGWTLALRRLSKSVGRPSIS